MKRGFEALKKDIILPQRATSYSAGYDFFCPEQTVFAPYEKKQVATYVKAYMQKEEHLQLHIRSSLALKRHLRLVNGVGIIDSDYYNNEDNEGHIFIALENCSDQTVIIEKGERFVQGIFLPYLVTDTDDVSRQRNGGLGSTGKK